MTLLPSNKPRRHRLSPQKRTCFCGLNPYLADAVQHERGLEPESSAAAGTGGCATAGT